MSDNNGSAPDAGSPPPGGAPPPAAGSDAPWYAGFEDAALRGKAEANGWKSPEDAVKNYATLEKHLGVPADRLLKLPEAADAPEWKEIRTKLGWPEAPAKPEDYGIQAGEGGNAEFATGMSKLLHETGISKDQAAKLVTGWDGIQKALMDAEAARLASEDQAGLAELRTKWGQQYDGSVALARRAGQELSTVAGLTPEQLNAMEGAVGTAAFLRLFAAAGSQNNKEGAFHGAEGAGSSTGVMMSPDVAKAEIERLKGDPEFGAAMIKEMESTSGKGPKRDRWEQLHRIAAGG